MAEFGQRTVRSAHPLNIFKKPEPKPLWVAEGASDRYGRRILVNHAIDEDGRWVGSSEDQGALAAPDAEPFFYMNILGGEVSMTMSDMKELMEGMREARIAKQKAEGKPLPDLKKMREQLRQAQEYINDVRAGRKRFAV